MFQGGFQISNFKFQLSSFIFVWYLLYFNNRFSTWSCNVVHRFCQRMLSRVFQLPVLFFTTWFSWILSSYLFPKQWLQSGRRRRKIGCSSPKSDSSSQKKRRIRVYFFFIQCAIQHSYRFASAHEPDTFT